MSDPGTHHAVVGDILVVEDSKADLKLLSDMLATAGYRVRPATDGKLALRSVQAKLPALILLDVGLPGIDGYEVCRRLKGSEETREVPVIFVSARKQVVDKVKGFSLGAVDYISKPYEAEEIVQRVKTHLALHQAQAGLEAAYEDLQQLNAELEDRVRDRTAQLERSNLDLSESEHKYRSLFEESRDGLLLTDAVTGTVLDCNSELARLLGYERSDLVGQHKNAVHKRDGGGGLSEPLGPQLTDDADQVHQALLTSATGEIRNVAIKSCPFELHGRSVELQSCRDITERKRAEEMLHRSEYIVSSSTDMLALLDGHFVYLAVNPAYAGAFGKTQDELIGHTPAEIFGTEFFDGTIRPQAERCLAGEEVRYQNWFEFPVSGRKYMDISYFPYVSPDGVIRGFTVSARDVSARRHAEEAARQAQQGLLDQERHETERVQIELDKVRGQLVNQTKLATIGQIAASIAHELRNPLGAVRNAAYYLKRHVPGENPKIPQYLGIIDQEVSTANRVIRDMMEMARSKEPAKETTDLRRTVSAAFAQLCPGEGVHCHVTLEPDPFTVYGDGGQLQQVLGNLMTNALHAMGDRGEITVEARRSADDDVIIVRDGGPGVAAEDRGRLFEPLFTTKAKGTGLGLTICRQIAERHGGTIDLVDQAGRGAAFCLRLPRQPAGDQNRDEEGESHHGTGAARAETCERSYR